MSSIRIAGARILVVEEDISTAMSIGACAKIAGAEVAGHVGSIIDALSIATIHRIDSFLMHTRHAADPMIRLLKHATGGEIAFFTGFDDWFECDEGAELDDIEEIDLSEPISSYG